MSVPLYIPSIGNLRQGIDYELATNERVTHANEFTTHPIEDPNKSFLIDSTKESPTTLSVTLIVTTEPCAKGAEGGIERLNRFQDSILALRAAQSVSNESYVSIYTGVRVYNNMAIAQIDFTRDEDSPNELLVDITFQEFRFARSPRLSSDIFLMEANNGPRSTQNERLVEVADRPLVEATKVRYAPQFRPATPSQETLIRVMLRKLGAPRLAALDILGSSGLGQGVF